MINFDAVARASDDFWFDHEFEVTQAQVERLSPSEWDEFERRCLAVPSESQERIAYVLGGIDTVASARLLLQLCERAERDAVLTAREALRSLTLESVQRAASELWPSASGRAINEILEWAEWTGRPGDR